MQRSLSIFLGLAISCAAFSQTAITITLKSNHQYSVFETEGWPVRKAKETASISGDTVKQPFKGASVKSRLFLVDETTGNVASKSRDELTTGNWAVVENHFSAAEQVEIEVLAPGGPIDSATVELTDGSGLKREELIDPSSKGKVKFWYVKFGELKVAVNYRGKSGMAAPVKQSFTLEAEREAPIPTFKVALPDGNSSAAASESPAGAKPAEATNAPASTGAVAPSGTGAAGNLLTTLIGLGVVGGVAYFILKYFRENGDKVQSTLTKLGADIPQPAGNSSPDPDPIQPIKPEPMQQIILDQPAVPVAPISPVAAPVATGVPKLIATDGSAFEIPDGEISVGREFGNGLIVPNDTVSRNHASIQKSGPMVTVTDHGSTNGTWVNGVKISAWTPLSSGDSVRFGSVEYRYEG